MVDTETGNSWEKAELLIQMRGAHEAQLNGVHGINSDDAPRHPPIFFAVSVNNEYTRELNPIHVPDWLKDGSGF